MDEDVKQNSVKRREKKMMKSRERVKHVANWEEKLEKLGGERFGGTKQMEMESLREQKVEKNEMNIFSQRATRKKMDSEKYGEKHKSKEKSEGEDSARPRGRSETDLLKYIYIVKVFFDLLKCWFLKKITWELPVNH